LLAAGKAKSGCVLDALLSLAISLGLAGLVDGRVSVLAHAEEIASTAPRRTERFTP